MKSFKKLVCGIAASASLFMAGAANAVIVFTPPVDAPNGGQGFVGILDVINNGGIGDQDQARASLASGGGTRLAATASVINHVGNGDSNPEGHFGGEILLPHGAVDNRAIIFRAPVHAPADGFYTFNVASDDGFTLAFDNGASPFVSQYNGALDTYNGNANGAVTFFGGRGTGDTGGAVFLTKGVHQMDLTFHDGCCGDDIELTAASGVQGGHNNNFYLVGATLSQFAPKIQGPMNVEVRRGSGAGNGGIAGALNAINNDIGAGFFGVTNVINHHDPQSGLCCGGVNNGNLQVLPGDTAGGDDDYAAQWTGTLNMPADGQVKFHIQSDDGFQFSVDGGAWQVISSANGGATTVQNGGQDLNADFYTGNSDVRALLTLGAGLHTFRFTLFEGGGGSYATVWMGGDAGQPGSILFGEGQGQLLFEPVTFGFGSVPEPATAMLGMMGLSLLGLRRRRAA